MTSVPNVLLNNGVEIPQLGFGVFQIEPDGHRRGGDAPRSRSATGTSTPPRCTATRRRSARRSASPASTRDEIFVTSKLNNGFHAYDDALQRVRPDPGRPRHSSTIDLFLIHWPLPTVGDYVDDLAGAGEDLRRRPGPRDRRVQLPGRTTCAGCTPRPTCVPAVNQIELHPYLTQDELRAFDAEHGIATEAWSPIAQGAVLDDPTIVEIAEAHGKTPAQVVLRWHIQLGNIVFPKSVTPSRIKENFEIFDFELTDADIGDDHRPEPRRAHRPGPGHVRLHPELTDVLA